MAEKCVSVTRWRWRVLNPNGHDADHRRPGEIGPIVGLGFGFTVLYLLLLFVTTAGAMNVVERESVAFVLYFLTLLSILPW